MHSEPSSRIISFNEFAEGWGFDALPIPMVAALPITAIALALAKGWFLNRNRKGDTNKNEHNEKDDEMKRINSSSNTNSNTSTTLQNAIGAILKVGYDTTVGMGAGALLDACKASTR